MCSSDLASSLWFQKSAGEHGDQSGYGVHEDSPRREAEGQPVGEAPVHPEDIRPRTLTVSLHPSAADGRIPDDSGESYVRDVASRCLGRLLATPQLAIKVQAWISFPLIMLISWSHPRLCNRFSTRLVNF